MLAAMQADVVIVGGGAIGATAALELARREARVTLLERGPALASGCSSGNAGLICPSHSLPLANPAALRNGLRWMWRRDSPFFLKPRPGALPWLARFALAAARAERAQAAAALVRSLSLRSLELHAQLASELATGFERRGLLNVYASETSFAAAVREAERSGLPFQALAGPAARDLEPALTFAAGAVYYPEEAHCDPLQYVRAVGQAAAERGATIRTGVEARRLRPGNGGLVVETSDGELRPGTVVLAAGAWSARLAASAGVFCPLEGGKGYHLDLEPAPGDPRIPCWLEETWAIATPLPGRLRLSGTLELAGLDLSIDRARVEAIRRGAARGLRGVDGRRVVEIWAGLRPCTPDGLPVIGRPARLPALVLATGHAMKGLALAPITAALVSSLVVGEEPSFDLAAFSPDRFRPLLPRPSR
jgi:D-amino-acid dehydrogenase